MARHLNNEWEMDNELIKDYLSAHLKELNKKKTYTEIADIIGVERKSVMYLANHKKGSPSLIFTIRILKLFGKRLVIEDVRSN